VDYKKKISPFLFSLLVEGEVTKIETNNQVQQFPFKCWKISPFLFGLLVSEGEVSEWLVVRRGVRQVGVNGDGGPLGPQVGGH